MSKLYPPVIEESLPAFYSENGIVKFTIPFSMNRAVSFAEIGGFELKIKTIQNSTYLYTIETYRPTDYSFEKDNLHVSFYLNDINDKLKIGQFYKLQLAYIYIDKNVKNQFLSQYYEGKISVEEFETAMSQRKEIGYYSSAGIAKYTTKPKLYINNLRPSFLNTYTNKYTGCYEQITTDGQYKDSTEKVYSYKFDFYDSTGKEIIATTGYQLHNTSLDSNVNYSQDYYDLNQDIAYDTIYYIQYSVITINGLQMSSPKYKLIQRELIDAQIDVTINPSLNVEEGYIDIRMGVKENELGLIEVVTGAFILLRSDENSNYKDWVEMSRFKLNDEIPSSTKILFRDYTIEQGKKYKYAIQQYNDSNLYSNKIYSDVIQADFEYAFLFDGQKQLKIKYNSKMTKFTNTRLEQKIDTIGGQYPFIFRNGHVNYHEFPIGGLISYFMDEEHLFVPIEELITEEKTINYTIDNIAQERIFKMKVLEWLNNGQPKIFRSPTEGNFIIRLLKVSMTPEQKLGRLLHNFTATAYEIAEYNYNNICKYNFINTKDYDNNILSIITVNLENIDPGEIINKNQSILQTIQCQNMIPGEELLITFTDGSQEKITIGVTGNYFLNNSLNIQSIIILPKYEQVQVLREKEFDENLYYRKIKGEMILAKQTTSKIDWLETYYKIVNKKLNGLITYSYFTTPSNTFGIINNITMNDCSIDQLIGKYNILETISQFNYGKNKYIKNPKRKITDYYNLKVYLRPVEYYDNNSNTIQFYNNEIDLKQYHPFTLYLNKNTNEYFDLYANKYYNNYETYISINNEKIYITHDTEFNLSDLASIIELSSGNGVIVEIVYQTKEIEYAIETTSQELLNKKQEYLNSKEYYEEYLKSGNIENSQLLRYKDDMLINYKNYLNQLIALLDKQDGDIL